MNQRQDMAKLMQTPSKRVIWMVALLLMALQANLSFLRPSAQQAIIEDTKGGGDSESSGNGNTETQSDQEHFKEILDTMKVDYSNVSDQLLSDAWSRARDLYYSQSTGPVIIGLERCEEFRRLAGPNAKTGMAGLFNSGTNALARNLINNVGFPNNTETYDTRNNFGSNGIHSEVPWWKHNPLVHKYRGNTPNAQNYLPIVIVRDPFFWRKSTQDNPYTLRCNNQRLCGWFNQTLTLNIQNAKNPTDQVDFASLEAMWNDLHSTYLKASFPRLIVRFEDALFYLPTLVQKIGECAGATPKQDEFVVLSKYAKKHGHDRSSLLNVMLKAVDQEKRLEDLLPLQIEQIKRDLDPELLKLFSYKLPYINQQSK